MCGKDQSVIHLSENESRNVNRFNHPSAEAGAFSRMHLCIEFGRDRLAPDDVYDGLPLRC